MRLRFLTSLLTFFFQFVSAESTNIKAGRIKTFESKKNGYVFSYSECFNLEHGDADEMNLKIESADIVIISPNKTCKSSANLQLHTIGVSPQPLKGMSTQDSINFLFNDYKNKATRDLEKYHLFRPKRKVSYDFLVLQENMSYLRWQFFVDCSDRIFRILIDTHKNIKLSDKFRKKLLNQDFSDIKTELSIIESFKCNKKT
jgi:hypothetical protein